MESKYYIAYCPHEKRRTPHILRGEEQQYYCLICGHHFSKINEGKE